MRKGVEEREGERVKEEGSEKESEGKRTESKEGINKKSRVKQKVSRGDDERGLEWKRKYVDQ